MQAKKYFVCFRFAVDTPCVVFAIKMPNGTDESFRTWHQAHRSHQPLCLHILHLLGCHYNVSGTCTSRFGNSACQGLRMQHVHHQIVRNEARRWSRQSQAQVDSPVDHQ